MSFRVRFRKIERKIRDCWRILASLKTAPDPSLRDFQPLLSEVLMALEDEYVKLSRERRRIISRKRSVSTEWFLRRQRLLAKQQLILRRTILIGKSLGDAFAWFFYQEDPNLLHEHARQPESRTLAVGQGGKGELHFVRGVRFLHGAFVIYHGITSLLRLGDISLVNLRSRRVLAIGELKTTPHAQGQMLVQLILTSRERLPSGLVTAAEGLAVSRGKTLPVRMQARLERQLQRTSQALTAASRERTRVNVSLGRQSYHNDLRSLLARLKTNRFTYRRAGPGMLLAAYRARENTLYAAVADAASGRAFGAFGQEFDQTVTNLFIPGSPFNSLILTPLVYSGDFRPVLLHGTTPVFWWPLEIDTLRDLLLSRTIAISIYNPAHLFARVEDAGFRVVDFRPPGNCSLKRAVGDSLLRLERFEYFVQLVCHSLVTEDQALSLLMKASEAALARGVTGPVKCDLEFVHRVL